MLRDEGPVSSFEEDLKALGIGHLFEDAAKAPASKVVTESDDSDEDEDEDSTEEGENPFAKYNAEKKKKNGDDKGEKKDDSDEDEKGEDEDEDEDDSDEDEDEDEKDEDEDYTEFDALCDEDEKLGAAVDVLGAFYNTLSESEDGAEFDHDALVGVIEAYEYMAEVTGLLDEAKRWKIRGGKRRRTTKGDRAKQKLARAGRELPMGKKMGAGGRPERMSAAEKKQARMMARPGVMGRRTAKHGGAMHAVKFGKKGRALASDVEETGSPITELVDNLAALKEAVQSNGNYQAEAGELKEGFNSIGETASTWMQSIAEEIRATVSEDENFDPDSDPRVQMGRHLDGIAESAAAIINKIDEGEADMEDAAADLQSLSADLNDAAEAMKEIA